jgi:hypothetical protein
MRGDVDRIALNDEPSRAAVDTWQQVMGVCYLIAQIPQTDVQALLAELDRTDTLMPILDPTGYRQIMGNISQHREVIQVFARLRAVIEKYNPAGKE